LEVLNSLATGDEPHIFPNRKRLEALSPLDPLAPTFLEMPGQFALREVRGPGPILVNTYQPWEIPYRVCVYFGGKEREQSRIRANCGHARAVRPSNG